MICGVDPGIDGAIAFFDGFALHSVHDMPVKKVSGKRFVDSCRLFELVRSHTPRSAFIERVWQLPRQSAQSGFTFGRNYQAVVSVMDILEVPVIEVEPQKWQRAVGIKGKTQTLSSVLAVSQWYPKADIYGPRGGTKDGRCDAILIAKYGASHLRSQ